MKFDKNTGTVDISKQCLYYAKFKTDMLQKHLCIVCVLTAPCTVTHTHTHTHTYTYIHLLIIVSEVCLFFLIVVSLLFYWRATNLVLLMEKVQHLFLFPSPPSVYVHMSYSLITCVSFLPLVQSLPVQLFSSLPIDGKKDPQHSIQSECECLQPGEKVRLHTHI